MMLKSHYKKLVSVTGLTPGDVKALAQDLVRVLGYPLPERVAGLLIRALDLSPVGGRKWVLGWLERTITKVELVADSGLQEMEPGYLGTLLEPSRLPGESRQAVE